MRPDLLGDRQTGGHQECRPVDGMEPDDVFSNDVDVGGPVALLFVIGTADGAEIRGERVEPNVKNVRLFTGNRNAPTNRSASDAQIAQAALDKAQYFVAARFRLDEFRMLGVPIEKRLLKRREFEEIVGFGDGVGGPRAIGRILGRLYVDVSIVIDTVLPCVMPGVDEALFAAQPEQPLAGMRELA